MGQSVLVFVSHSSEDKETFIEPLVRDLEDCFINVWLDKRKIIPGDNLRKSIFREGLDKADVALLFFTQNSLRSAWVDQEIKHVLREEKKKGNDFDLNKIITIFDSSETYTEIARRYPELTDDLLHLMPVGYSTIQLGQLVSAIWSKYLSLQGGDVEVQRQLLHKDREIFQKEQEIQAAKQEIDRLKKLHRTSNFDDEFLAIKKSGKVNNFIAHQSQILSLAFPEMTEIPDSPAARAFGFLEPMPQNLSRVRITDKGRDFFKWLLLNP